LKQVFDNDVVLDAQGSAFHKRDNTDGVIDSVDKYIYRVYCAHKIGYNASRRICYTVKATIDYLLLFHNYNPTFEDLLIGIYHALLLNYGCSLRWLSMKVYCNPIQVASRLAAEHGYFRCDDEQTAALKTAGREVGKMATAAYNLLASGDWKENKG
jgi:hypothetical protein